MKASLMVFFEDPFRVAAFERVGDGKLSVCEVNFGTEPKDHDVWEFALRHYAEPVFSPEQNAEFVLEITETGNYLISVSGHRAKGNVSFTRIPGGQE